MSITFGRFGLFSSAVPQRYCWLSLKLASEYCKSLSYCLSVLRSKVVREQGLFGYLRCHLTDLSRLSTVEVPHAWIQTFSGETQVLEIRKERVTVALLDALGGDVTNFLDHLLPESPLFLLRERHILGQQFFVAPAQVRETKSLLLVEFAELFAQDHQLARHGVRNFVV